MSTLSRSPRRRSAAPAVVPCLLLSACLPLAGTGPSLGVDRPGATRGAEVLARGAAQVEGGTTVTHGNGVRAVSAGELLVRAGVGGRAELRVGLPSYGHVAVSSLRVTGLEDASAGAKLALLAPDAAAFSRRPALSLLVGATLPTGAAGFRADAAQPEAALLLGWRPAARVQVGVNAGYRRLADADLRYGALSGSAMVGVAVGERLGLRAEAYGFAPEARDRSAYVSAGATWLLGPDLRLDARLGTGVHHAPGERVVGVGFARRF